MKKEKNIYELIAKHLAGELTSSEMALFEDWLREDDANKKLFGELKQVWNIKRDTADAKLDVDRSWEKLKPNLINNARPQGKLLWIGSYFTRIAAALILAFAIIFGVYRANEAHLMQKISFEKRKTGFEERDSIFLSDGSIVYLNGNSKVFFPNKFDGHTREIILEGEAFFKISPDLHHPFIIYSGKTMIRVVGTSFNIKCNHEKVVVTVQTGVVAFNTESTKGEEVLLEKGEEGIYNEETRTIEQTQAGVNYLSWKTGILYFNKKPLREVLDALEEHYNVEIQVENSKLDRCKLSSTFDKLTLEESMHLLKLMLGIDYKIHDDRVTINGKGC
ncbi:MAG TPA: FecR domain-containing protein [Cytophagaceae bacterium]|jgi:ferric-dicitrate binding protein FerR (iron transport regulator)